MQEYFFIPLDIFRKNIHNKGINTDLDAWLTFLTTDEPEMILKLTQLFPAFKEMYQDIYELCCNIERVMHMFSKELKQLDKNTVEYMIDEMQNEINQKNALLEEKDALLEEQTLQMQSVNQLYSLLMRDGRQEDMTRAFGDEAYRALLLKEYQLI